MTTWCDLARDWLLNPELAQRLVAMAERFRLESGGRELHVISGYRTCQENQELGRQGRPAAPCELSNHTICPARAADLRIDGFSGARQLKVIFGVAAVLSGLRWGGGSPTVDGIPSDWNHVDLGPRMDRVAQAYRERAGRG